MTDSTSFTTITSLVKLPDDIIQLIKTKLPFTTIYKFHLEGDINATQHLLKEGKKIIIQLDNLIHPDSGYPLIDYLSFKTNDSGMEYSLKTSISGAIHISGVENQNRLKDTPIATDFDFNNLENITKHIWNMLICVKAQTADIYKYNQLIKSASAFLTMESETPELYDTICDDIWKCLILEYLDPKYNSSFEWLGGYKKWKYICRAIDNFPTRYKINTLTQQKYALTILIITYLEHKDEIMHMYANEPESIDTDKKYYEELTSLIKTISGNGHLAASIICNQFVKNTFYFMSSIL